jgi:hypothetical protein
MHEPLAKRGTSRRDVLATGAAATIAVALTGRDSADTATASTTASFLFVQTADVLRYDRATKELHLVGVSPQTLFFTARPDRIAGGMEPTRFVPF